MSTWELINPSDKITFKADTYELACLAVGLMGGAYAADLLEGDVEPRQVPMFLFGGTDEHFKKHFGKDVSDTFEAADKLALADVLDSFLIGSMAERRAYEKALSVMPEADKAAFKEEWLDKERSSMNDICARAYGYANNLRKYNKETPANGE